MVKDTGAAEGRRGSGGAGRRGGKAPRGDAATPGRGGGGAADADPVGEASGDPWAEADAAHPDEQAMDAPDQHPRPDDGRKRDPGA